MFRDYWLRIKSLFVASSWSHLYRLKCYLTLQAAFPQCGVSITTANPVCRDIFLNYFQICTLSRFHETGLNNVNFLYYLLIYLHTPRSRVLLEKLTGFQLVKKFPAFYGTRIFIPAFTSARHLSLSWANSIQSVPPHPTSWIYIFILSSHLRLGLPSGFFPSDFPTKFLYTSLHSPIRATCPTHLMFLDFIARTILGEEYKSLSSSLCSFLHSLVTSSLLGPNILLSAIFSNTVGLLFPLSVRDQVSHTYETKLWYYMFKLRLRSTVWMYGRKSR